MRLNLLAVGTKMPTWVNDGYEEYAKRLPRECQLVLQEIQPAKRGKSGHASQWVEEEERSATRHARCAESDRPAYASGSGSTVHLCTPGI
jgi:23S rRNA pseudoU1915 N3-methylase RlmH